MSKKIALLVSIALVFEQEDGTDREFNLKVKKPSPKAKKEALKYAKQLEKDYPEFSKNSASQSKLEKDHLSLSEEVEDLSLLIQGAKEIPMALVEERRSKRAELKEMAKQLENAMNEDVSTAEEIETKVQDYMWNMIVKTDTDGLKNWIEEDYIDMEDVLDYIQNATQEAIGKK